jgi:hypothetical protein
MFIDPFLSGRYGERTSRYQNTSKKAHYHRAAKNGDPA